jgi:hypothetical protein
VAASDQDRLPGAKPQRFDAVVGRHHPELPVYVMVPSAVPATFGKQGTFVVEAAVDRQDIGRRSIKPWGDGRWFMELTRVHCRRLGVGPGSRVAIEVSLAQEVPADLAARLDELELRQQWQSRPAAKRRAAAEIVFEARRPATRRARIGRIVASLRTDGS